MEQKFKVGDLVKVNKGDGIFYYGTIERVFETYCQVVSDFNRSTLFPNNSRIELRYPSDHDLLDYAARDSKIEELQYENKELNESVNELTAENEALKAELEKYKPKPESITKEVVMCKYPIHENKVFISHVGDTWDGFEVIARKVITITEGEGM